MDLKNRLKRLVQSPASISKSTSFNEALGGRNDWENCRSSQSTSGHDNTRSNLPTSSTLHNFKGQRDFYSKYTEIYKDYNREREFRLATKQRQHRDPTQDELSFSTIEKIYFDAKNVAQCEDHVIYNLPQVALDEDYIVSEKNRLKKQLTVVSRKVSELMLVHQPEYNEELQRVIDLQILLNDAINLTAKSRSNLKLFKSNVTLHILSIIHDERRRRNAYLLLECLQKRREHLLSKSPSDEVSIAECKEDGDSDQFNNTGSGASSHVNSPQSKSNSIAMNVSGEVVTSRSQSTASQVTHANLPHTNSYDCLLSVNVDKSTASALEVRSNSLTPVPQVTAKDHSPASR